MYEACKKIRVSEVPSSLRYVSAVCSLYAVGNVVTGLIAEVADCERSDQSCYRVC